MDDDSEDNTASGGVAPSYPPFHVIIHPTLRPVPSSGSGASDGGIIDDWPLFPSPNGQSLHPNDWMFQPPPGNDASFPNDWTTFGPGLGGAALGINNAQPAPSSNGSIPAFDWSMPAARQAINLPLPPPEAAWDPPIFPKDLQALAAGARPDSVGRPAFPPPPPVDPYLTTLGLLGPLGAPPDPTQFGLLGVLGKSQSSESPAGSSPPTLSPGIIPAPKGMWPPPASPVSPPGNFYVVPADSDALTRAGGDPTLRDLTQSSWPISKVGGPMPPPPSLISAPRTEIPAWMDPSTWLGPPSEGPLWHRATKAGVAVLAPLLSEELNNPWPQPIPKVVPPSGRIGREPSPLAAAAIDLAVLLAPEARAIGPARRAYSVAFETVIPKVGVGTRPAHNIAANKLLQTAIDSNPEFAGMMNRLGIQVPSDLRKSPMDWTWHHVADRPGVMQLMPRPQHQSPALRPLLHPEGRGGYARWGNQY